MSATVEPSGIPDRSGPPSHPSVRGRRLANTPPAFVELCKLLREDAHIPETRYAIEILRISSSSWSHVIQTGIRGPGSTFMVALTRTYPHLAGLFTMALAGLLEDYDREDLRAEIDLRSPRPPTYASNVEPITLGNS